MSILLIGMILLYSNYNKLFINSGKISYNDNVEDIYTAYYVYQKRENIGYNNGDIQSIFSGCNNFTISSEVSQHCNFCKQKISCADISN